MVSALRKLIQASVSIRIGASNFSTDSQCSPRTVTRTGLCWVAFGELRHNFTAYDAVYIALAEATNSVLYTSDGDGACKGHRARVALFNG